MVIIGFAGTHLPEGKVRFEDVTLHALAQKDKPKKVSPFYAEFIPDEYERSDVIAISEDNVLDLLILDMEKIETRSARLTDDSEKQLMTRCLEHLENDTPLCDVGLEGDERKIVESAAPLSLKPVIKLKGDEKADTIISRALEKAGYMFFYTSGSRESHAWLVSKGSDIVACAGRIHSDLARGFIKGDVVSFEDYMNCHSFNECRSKGYTKLVDRDYIVQPNEIVEIRFNVSNGS